MTSYPASSTQFIISYQGESLSDHMIDVKDLAPALQALGQMFELSNRVLNGDNTTVSLKIRSTQPGSFEILLFLAQVYHTSTTVFSGDFFTSAANLRTVIIGSAGSYGLISLKKFLKGNKPDTVERVGNEIKLYRETPEEIVDIIIPFDVYALSENKDIQELVQTFVSPIHRNGIDRMEVKDDEHILEFVEKKDLSSFQVQPDDGNSETTDYIIPRQRLEVVSPNLREVSAKWRLHDGSSVNWYTISDMQFQQDVQDQVKSFTSGDILVCEVRVIQSQSIDGKPTNEFEILEVFDHHTRGDQGIQLPLGD